MARIMSRKRKAEFSAVSDRANLLMKEGLTTSEAFKQAWSDLYCRYLKMEVREALAFIKANKI